MLKAILLIACICIIIAIILYLFFWNRVVASIFSFLLRLYSWGQGESSIWIDIGKCYIFAGIECVSHVVVICMQELSTSPFWEAESCSKIYDITPVTKLSRLSRAMSAGDIGCVIQLKKKI